jgi:hypothetical protein
LAAATPTDILLSAGQKIPDRTKAPKRLEKGKILKRSKNDNIPFLIIQKEKYLQTKECDKNTFIASKAVMIYALFYLVV